MNKRQARRIALAHEACYILMGAESEKVFEYMSEADFLKFQEAQYEIAWSNLRKAGFDNPMPISEIIDIVLNRV